MAAVITRAQTNFNSRDLQPSDEYENVHVQQLYSDSLATTFVIWVKREVKSHYHAFHTEQVIILDGRARMQVGDRYFVVKKGDVLVIPAGTVHNAVVTSRKPLKVLSIQSPEFLGDDRVIVDG